MSTAPAPGVARQLLSVIGAALAVGALAGALDYTLTHAAAATFRAAAGQLAFAVALYGAGIAAGALAVWLLDGLLARLRRRSAPPAGGTGAWARRLLRADLAALLAPLLLVLLIFIHRVWLDTLPLVAPQSLTLTGVVCLLAVGALVALPRRLAPRGAAGARRLRSAHGTAAAAGSAAFALALVVAGGAGRGAAGAAGSTPRNVLLISIDSLRKDVFDAYLADHASPRLRAFAAGARRYQAAYTTFAHSLPSHASMLTGLYPLEHGARVWRRDGGDEGSAVAGDVERLAEAFAAAGYETVAVADNGWLGPPYGLERGFETFLNTQTPLRLATSVPVLAFADFGLARALHTGLSWVGLSAHPQSSWTRAWLARRARARPFFALLHYMEMHVPNAPPARYRERFAASGRFAGRSGFEIEAAIADGRIGPGELDAARAHLHALSLADLARVDDLLAPVLAELEAGGYLESTLVVLTSDHGDNFYERVPEYAHSHVYESSVRVPLLLRVPGAAGGGTIETPVSLVDLAPTLRAFAGLPPARRSSGVDLLALPDAAAERPLQLEGFDRQRSGWVYGVRRGPFKLVVQGDGARELYRLDADPGETRDLSARLPEVTESLHASVETLRAAAGDGPFAPVSPRDLPPELFEQLKRLGYVE